MPFFDKVGDALNKTGKDIRKKAKEIGDTSSLLMEKTQLLSDVEKLYIEIGKAVYEANDEKYCVQIEAIRNNFKRVSEIETELDLLKGKMKCPHCGLAVNTTDHYCTHCGHDLSSEDK